MANYSTDDNLEIFIKNIASLDLPLKKYHTEAYTQIRRSLLLAGVSEDTLDDLDSNTLADLVAPSCHYALYQYFQGFPSSPELLTRAQHHLKEHERTMALVTIKDSGGTEEVPSYGSVKLG